jgi:octaprenyl-diphosphate synthase
MDQEYTRRLEKIEAELERQLPKDPQSGWAQDIFTETGKKAGTESINTLLAPLGDILSRGGKRWRPLLMTLVCEALGGEDAALPLSPLVEFSHNASLIHDDIEDESDERRGKPAIHKIYGVDTAINSGSFFYFLSSCCIETCGLKNKERIYKFWTDCMRTLHLGQAMDISWHRNISFIPEINDYFLMCGMKTGGLSRLAAELGAFAANAPEAALRQLGEAAEKLGIGFQILDDVKNLTTGIPGKKRGDDMVEGKKSLPILLYLHKYPEKRELVFRCFLAARTGGAAVPETEVLIQTLIVSGVLTEAEEKGLSLIQEARGVFGSREFSGCPVSEKGNDLLDGFIDLIS